MAEQSTSLRQGLGFFMEDFSGSQESPTELERGTQAGPEGAGREVTICKHLPSASRQGEPHQDTAALEKGVHKLPFWATPNLGRRD